ALLRGTPLYFAARTNRQNSVRSIRTERSSPAAIQSFAARSSTTPPASAAATRIPFRAPSEPKLAHRKPRDSAREKPRVRSAQTESARRAAERSQRTPCSVRESAACAAAAPANPDSASAASDRRRGPALRIGNWKSRGQNNHWPRP